MIYTKFIVLVMVGTAEDIVHVRVIQIVYVIMTVRTVDILHVPVIMTVHIVDILPVPV